MPRTLGGQMYAGGGRLGLGQVDQEEVNQSDQVCALSGCRPGSLLPRSPEQDGIRENRIRRRVLFLAAVNAVCGMDLPIRVMQSSNR